MLCMSREDVLQEVLERVRELKRVLKKRNFFGADFQESSTAMIAIENSLEALLEDENQVKKVHTALVNSREKFYRLTLKMESDEEGEVRILGKLLREDDDFRELLHDAQRGLTQINMCFMFVVKGAREGRSVTQAMNQCIQIIKGVQEILKRLDTIAIEEGEFLQEEIQKMQGCMREHKKKMDRLRNDVKSKKGHWSFLG